jgi:hypothetical protein
MVWWPFAPKPERADTLEVTDLYSGAPPLYSTSFVVIFGFSFSVADRDRLGSQLPNSRSSDSTTIREKIDGKRSKVVSRIVCTPCDSAP